MQIQIIIHESQQILAEKFDGFMAMFNKSNRVRLDQATAKNFEQYCGTFFFFFFLRGGGEEKSEIYPKYFS